MASALIHVPKTAKRGDLIEIKTLVSHEMETGYRRSERGVRIPRNIIRRFVCTYDGEEILRAEFHPAVSANPYMAFWTRATESGSLEFRWTGDRGFSLVEKVAISVA